jgi:hypothetical protein
MLKHNLRFACSFNLDEAPPFSKIIPPQRATSGKAGDFTMKELLPPSTTGRTRRLYLVLFLLFFLTYAYGRQTPTNSNTISRTALNVALLHEGRLTIDSFEMGSCDKAYCNGHYYSEKAPGLSVAAIPVMGATCAVLKAAGKDDFSVNPATLEFSKPFKLLTGIATVFTSGLFTALAATALFWICRKLGCDWGGALFASVGFGLATPAWGWATAFFGHALAGSCLLLGFALAIAILEGFLLPRREFLGWIAVGFLLGYSVATEYPATFAAAIIGLMIGWKVAASGPRRFIRTLVAGLIGALPCAALIMTYNYLAFGSCFDLGYKHQVGFEGMKSGFVGLTYPKFDALWGILLSYKQGLLWISPLMALVPIAFYVSWQFRSARVYLLTSLLVVVYFLGLNSSFHYWGGGWSTGPRYITPALGFACFPLGFMWSKVEPRVRGLMLNVLELSFLLSLACVNVRMDVPSDFANPLFEMLLPNFVHGKVNNLGALLGVPGLLSLLPLIGLWFIAGRRILSLLTDAKDSGCKDAVQAALLATSN